MTTDNKNIAAEASTEAYERAALEWSERVGSARVQAKNWRLACMLSLVLVILMLVAMIVLINVQKTYVYVAEVRPQENIINVKSADQTYVPTQAQEEFFVARFIKQIMTLPLDPVVARENWLMAYSVVQGKAVDQLNTYARGNDPFKNIGNYTKSVEIRNFHPIGNHSYEFEWLQTVYDDKGAVKETTLFDGLFTVVIGQKPQNVQEMLANPLGLKIAYFTFTNEGH